MGISALLASQILDASATGRSVLTGADAAAIRTTLGLGTLATQSPTGTPSASTFLRGDFSWQTIDLSGYVPYSGATGAVNLGANAFTASQATLAAGTLNGTVLDIAQTWGGTGTYTGIKYNVTDSGPANAASLLMDLQVGGASRFSVRKNGNLTLANNSTLDGPIDYTNGSARFRLQPTYSALLVGSTNAIDFNSGYADSGALSIFNTWCLGWGSNNGFQPDLRIFRDAANTLAQRNGTNAQTFRVYNLFTDASNYERGKIAWESNVLRIGTEKAGTGSARALELQTDGVTRLTIATNGLATFSADVQIPNGALSFGSDRRIIAGASGSPLRILYTSSAVANVELGGLTATTATFSGNVTVSAVNLVTDTTTGTKIGTATTQKLGFFNATPVVQPTAVANATDAASVITQLNALLSRMRDLGLIAT